jgi:hypothetical protein
MADQVLSGELQSQVFVTAQTIHHRAITDYIAKESVIAANLIMCSEIDRIVREEADMEYRKKIAERETDVMRMQTKRSWRLATDCYFHWKDVYLKHKRHRNIKRTFPASSVETVQPVIVPVIEFKRKISKPTFQAPLRSPSPAKKRMCFDNMPEPKVFAQRVQNTSNSATHLFELNCSLPRSVEDQVERLQSEIYEERKAGHEFNKSFEAINNSFNTMDELDF